MSAILRMVIQRQCRRLVSSATVHHHHGNKMSTVSLEEERQQEQEQPTMFDIVSSGTVGDLIKIYSSTHSKLGRAEKMSQHPALKDKSGSLGSLAQNFILSSKLDINDWEGALEELKRMRSPNLFTFELIFRSLYLSSDKMCDPKKAALMAEELFQLMTVTYSIPMGGSPICWLARLSLALPQFDSRVLELYDALCFAEERPKFLSDSSLHLGLLERAISKGSWKVVYRILALARPINPLSPVTVESIAKVAHYLSLPPPPPRPSGSQNCFAGTAFQYNLIFNQLKLLVPNPLSLPLLRFLLDQLKNYDLGEHSYHWLLVSYCRAGKRSTLDIAHYAFVRLCRLYKEGSSLSLSLSSSSSSSSSALPPLHYLKAFLRCDVPYNDPVLAVNSASLDDNITTKLPTTTITTTSTLPKTTEPVIQTISKKLFDGNSMKQCFSETDKYKVMIDQISKRSSLLHLGTVTHRGRYGASSTNFTIRDYDSALGVPAVKRMTEWMIDSVFYLNSSVTPSPPTANTLFDHIASKVRRIVQQQQQQQQQQQ